jgi:hypothetical protein
MREHLPSDQISDYLFNGHLSYPDNDRLPEELDLFINELEKTLAIVPEPNESRMLANRSLFLTLGAELATQQEPKKGWFASFGTLWPKLLWQSAVYAIFLLMLLLGVRMVSANSLPGEQLYLIKLSLEPVDAIFQDQEQWEQKIEARRRQEVLLLIKHQGEAKVYFEGMLEETASGWQMMALPLVLTPEQQEIAHLRCEGHPVKVQGQVSKGSLQIIDLTPTCLELDRVQLAKNREK